METIAKSTVKVTSESFDKLLKQLLENDLQAFRSTIKQAQAVVQKGRAA